MEKMNSVAAIKAYLEGEYDGGPGRPVTMDELKATGSARPELGKMCADRMTALGRPVEIA